VSATPSPNEVRERLRSSLTSAAPPAPVHRRGVGRVNTDLDPELRSWFKRAAEDADTTMMAVLADFVAALQTDSKLARRFLRPSRRRYPRR
jgi:hypothetical protein